MARCPLCAERSAKRFCPAKQVLICATCCGTRREVDIDCPISCSYLRSGRAYESEKRVPDPELVVRVKSFDKSLIYRYGFAIEEINLGVVEERQHAPWLVDSDVIEVYKALHATMKTLSSGIYYETLPEGAARVSLYRQLKASLDELMTPNPEAGHPVLKVSEALEVLDFLTFMATVNSNVRPRSRQYLDWLSMSAQLDEPPEEASRLILP